MNLDWLTKDITALLMQGLSLTLLLTAITSILSLLAGVAIGTLRLSRRRIWRGAAAVYVELFRNIPALVLIIFWAFALPNLFPAEMRQTLFFDNPLMNWLSTSSGLSLPYYALAAGLALTLNTSAYLAELFRAGVGTIAQEHLDAARTLGGSSGLVFRRILLPQGLKASFPAVSTRLIHNMKNTALAAFVSVPEYFHATETAITRTFRALEFFLLAAVIYLLLAFIFSGLLRFIEHRLERPRPVQVAGVTYAK